MDALQKRLDAAVAHVTKTFEGRIDFEGQKLADRRMHWVLISTGVVAYVVGTAVQSLRVLYGIFTLGFLLAMLVVVPPWSDYNRHPISWLPPKPSKPKTS